MSDIQGSIDELPATYRALVGEVAAVNRDLACAGMARMRRRPAWLRSFLLLRKMGVKTAVYLTAVGQEVRFFFFRRPKTEELVLKLDLQFVVTPFAASPFRAEDLRVKAILPEFLSSPFTIPQMQRIAEGLQEDDWTKIQFLRAGTFIVGVVRAEDEDQARVTWLRHANALQAESAYQKKADGNFLVNPLPFLSLLEEMRAWVADPINQGRELPVPLREDAPRPMQRIVAAIANGWIESANAAQLQKQWNDPLGDWLPPLSVQDYNANLVIRLRSNGQLAEKDSEDAFRLRLMATVQAEDDGPVARLSVAPPDFLLSGDMHDQLLDNLLQPFPVARIFADTQLKKFERQRFEKFLQDACKDALVFRVRRSGDNDTDLFAFQGDWNGERQFVIVAATFKVLHEDDGSLRIRVDADSIQAIYCNLNGGSPELKVELPQYMLRLLSQLQHWRTALE